MRDLLKWRFFQKVKLQLIINLIYLVCSQTYLFVFG